MTKHSKARELGQGSHAMLTNNILPEHISLSDMTASKHSPASQLFASFSLFTLLLFLLCTLVPTLPLALDGTNISSDTSARSTNSFPLCKNAHSKHIAEQNITRWKCRCKQTFQEEATFLRCIRPSWNLLKQQIDNKKMFTITILSPQSNTKHQDLLLARRSGPLATFILSLCSPNSYFFQPLMIPNCENLLNYFAYLI